jgi:hypothetical protein
MSVSGVTATVSRIVAPAKRPTEAVDDDNRLADEIHD